MSIEVAAEQQRRGPKPKWIPTSENIDYAASLAAKGLSIPQIASCVGISRATFFKIKGECQELSDALDKARVAVDIPVIRTMYEMATSGKCYPATKYWLAVKCGWIEPTEEKKSEEDVEKQISDAAQNVFTRDY